MHSEENPDREQAIIVPHLILDDDLFSQKMTDQYKKQTVLESYFKGDFYSNSPGRFPGLIYANCQDNKYFFSNSSLSLP